MEIAAPPPRQLAVELVAQPEAVREPGERVVHREVREPLLGLLEIADVAGDEREALDAAVGVLAGDAEHRDRHQQCRRRRPPARRATTGRRARARSRTRTSWSSPSRSVTTMAVEVAHSGDSSAAKCSWPEPFTWVTVRSGATTRTRSEPAWSASTRRSMSARASMRSVTSVNVTMTPTAPAAPCCATASTRTQTGVSPCWRRARWRRPVGGGERRLDDVVHDRGVDGRERGGPVVGRGVRAGPQQRPRELVRGTRAGGADRRRRSRSAPPRRASRRDCRPPRAGCRPPTRRASR